MRARRAIHWIAFPIVALTLAGPATRAAAENIAFVTVALDDETRAADKALRDYLHDKTQLQFDPMEMEYAAAIQRLAGWKRGSQPYLARMTPYAYVAAEMLGASFEILGTYNSKATGVTTYHSYFVVNRKNFSRPNPGLGDLLAFLRSRPARFVYHDRFSTSSYFLPALYFRSQRIFATSEASGFERRDHLDPGHQARAARAATWSSRSPAATPTWQQCGTAPNRRSRMPASTAGLFHPAAGPDSQRSPGVLAVDSTRPTPIASARRSAR